MLVEFTEIRQEKHSEEGPDARSGFRRFFSSENLQLFLWYDRQDGILIGFQLVMMEESGEPGHAFTWEQGKTPFFTGVMSDGFYNPTPILVANGTMPKNRVLELFIRDSQRLDPQIAALVAEKIRNYRDDQTLS